MYEFDDTYPTPVSDPEADGLPETADDNSQAYDEVLSGRIADGPEPAPLPPDRDDGPLALDEFGTRGDAGLRGEAIFRRLRREVPDFTPAGVRLDPDARLSEEADPDTIDQVPDDSMLLAQDTAVQARLGSHVSVFDRAITGVPLLVKVGRLVRPDEGGPVDADSEEVAYDAGASGGGASAEEAAMHLVRLDTGDGEDEPDEGAREDASL
jgi:Family of unknown function (DUF5709)